MQFKAKQDDLSEALTFVSSAIQKTTLPVLENVLLSAENGELKLTATDMQIQKSVKIPASVSQEGSITVAGKKLSSLVRLADPTKDMVFKLSKNKATLSSGRARWVLTTIPASEFPEFDAGNAAEAVGVASAELSDAIARCESTMANGDVRYYLNGMLFDIDQSELKVVSTDGHRLTKIDLNVDSSVTTQAIIPNKSIRDIKSLVDKHQDSAISIGDSSIVVSGGNMVIHSKLIDGKFPDYTRVIPSGSDYSIEADVSELKAALQRTLILANQTYNGVRFTVTDGSMHLEANNPEQDEACEDMPVNSECSDTEKGFNGSYVLDALTKLKQPSMTWGWSDGQASIITEDNLTCVIMEMRM